MLHFLSGNIILTAEMCSTSDRAFHLLKQIRNRDMSS